MQERGEGALDTVDRKFKSQHSRTVLLSYQCSKAKRVDFVAWAVESNQITLHFFSSLYSSRCFQVALHSDVLF